MIKFSLDNEIDYCQNDKSQNNKLDVFGIFADLVVELVLGHNGVQIPSEDGENAVPASSTNRGE